MSRNICQLGASPVCSNQTKWGAVCKVLYRAEVSMAELLSLGQITHSKLSFTANS